MASNNKPSRRGLFVGGAPLVIAGTISAIVLWWYFMEYDPDERSGRKVPNNLIDYENAKVQFSATFNVDDGSEPIGYYYIDDNWTPANIAGDLFTSMNNTTAPGTGVTERSKAWGKVAYMNADSLAWLHNYWIENINGVSLYEWINWEYVLPYTVEEIRKDQALSKLSSFGLL